MKIIFLILSLNTLVFAAERDCLKEYHEFRLAGKMTDMWLSDLEDEGLTIEKICSRDEADIDATIEVNRISEKKAKKELYIKHTITMGSDDAIAFVGDLEGEISNEEICEVLDKELKGNFSCDRPVEYLRSIRAFEYKDYKKICLEKLTLQKKMKDSCRK